MECNNARTSKFHREKYDNKNELKGEKKKKKNIHYIHSKVIGNRSAKNKI